MGIKSRPEYLQSIRERYQRVGRTFKSKILDEFCAACGYHRKQALRLLRQATRPRRRRRGRKPQYDALICAILKDIWLATDQLCSKRWKAALPLWLPYYEQQHGRLLPAIRHQLLPVSPATIDAGVKLVGNCRDEVP